MWQRGSHLVFVYGTLKKGEPNHDLIEEGTRGTGKFVGKAETVKTFPMVIASRHNIPYVLYHEGKGNNIIGEVYEIDDEMFAKLDELEAHPVYYTRLPEEVRLFSDSDKSGVLRPWIYFLINFRSELLELPFIAEYSSKGPHGLEYVSRDNGPTDQDYYCDVMNV